MGKTGDNHILLQLLSVHLICLIGFGGEKEQDRIISLPGQPSGVNFNHYSGYVTVDSLRGRALFYYFVESPVDSSTKPLVLWLNGGPGCSPIGYSAAFGEVGPFKVNRDGKTLSSNKYGWHKEANIIFLDNSAGVGFSYTNTTSDYELSSDQMSAEDSYIFLLNWMERFPAYKTRDFYLTGFSYGGHHVPQLAQLILQGNDKKTRINLRGIAIGNGFIDFESLCEGRPEFYVSHALIPNELKAAPSSRCNISFNSRTESIKEFMIYLQQSFTVSGNISIDNIYAPLCVSSSTVSNSDTAYDPCVMNYVAPYMNMPDVQAALHANITKLPYPWEECSFKIASLWNDFPATMLPVIQELMEQGLPVWLYSGDLDARMPFTATQYAIRKMKLPVETPWHAWYTEGEVGGYVVGYKNLTFATIRGAGHIAHFDQPARALAVFSSFLRNKFSSRD